MGPATEDQIYIGTSGWSYKDWDGPFYPQGCSQEMRLAHYASRFSCVEVDSTFYGVPKKETVRAWAERTPGRFRFALKVPGIVTHGAQGSRPILEDVLKDKEGRLADFLETAELLGDTLGPSMERAQHGPNIAQVSVRRAAIGGKDLDEILVQDALAH